MESKNGLKIIGKIELPSVDQTRAPHTTSMCARCGNRHRWLIYSSSFGGNVCDGCLIDLDNEFDNEFDF